MNIKVIVIFMLLMICTQSVRSDVTDGLVGWWKLDEAAGNAMDSSGSGNTGTPTGTTIVSGCKRNNCRNFDGNTDLVSIGTAASLAPASISVVLWFKASGAPADYDAPAGKAVNSTWSAGAWGFFYQSSFLKFWIQDYVNNIASKAYPSDNNWHHLAGTWDGTTIKIYVDAVLGGNDVYSGAMSTGGDLQIGNITGTAARGWPGRIDDVRVYNRALSQNEISAIYLTGTPHVSVKGGGRISGMKAN